MKGAIIIAAIFLAGVLSGIFHLFPESFGKGDITTYVLWLLLFLAGFGVGSDPGLSGLFKRLNLSLVFMPFVIIAGTYLGVLLAWLLVSRYLLSDCLAIGSGMGYYSLSGIILSESRGETIGTMALIANLTREIFTILAAPLLVRWFGPLGIIASGGATSMDTTLSMVMRYSGKEYIFVSVFSGVVLTILVPFLVGIFM